MNKTFLGLAGAALGTAMMAGSAYAVPGQTVFTAAGLGLVSDWNAISLPEIFGSGSGNGFFIGGGSAEVELRLADYGNSFGTADNNDHSPSSQIFSTSDAVGASKTWTPVDNSFVFYFATDGAGQSFEVGSIFSDDNDGHNGELDMYIYQSKADPSYWAFFFDDGGPNGAPGSPTYDDNDDNDMVVTVRQSVPEPASLAIFGVALAGLGLARRRRRS